MAEVACPYCSPSSEEVIWSDDQLRVLLIRDTPFTGWCRVIWNDHVKELTDLTANERNSLMAVVSAVEAGLRQLLAPEKINLASLGTTLPHVHWHVIPRYVDDSHFPEPIWGTSVRPPGDRRLPDDFVAKMQRHLSRTLSMDAA